MSRYEDFKNKALAEYIDHDRFIRVRDMVLERMEKRRFFDARGVYGDGGFGVLAEKTLHATLKYYAQPDDDFHEVAMYGFFCRHLQGWQDNGDPDKAVRESEKKAGHIP